MMFALIVTGKEMRCATGEVVGAAGERYWVVNEPEGWVEASSISCSGCAGRDGVPADVKLFETPAAAAKFAKRWKGHPWWCSPTGEYELVEIKPRFKTVPDGYDRA